MSITSEWQSKGGRAVLEVLAERGEPMHISEISQIVRDRLKPDGEALDIVANGYERWWDYVAWGSTDLRAARWIEKPGAGMWSITDAGRQALIDHPDPDELRSIAKKLYRASLPAEPTRRAWLVRGTPVRGESLVPTWLADGFVSLAATRLASLPVGEELRVAVESGYEHLPFSERTEKVNELVAFIEKVGEGDLVVTAAGGELYVGDVTGAAELVASDEGRSNLRRPVLWRNADAPLDYAELPAGVAAKFQGGGTLVELTAQLGEIDATLSEIGAIDEDDEQRPVSASHHERLDHFPPGSVADLHISDTWANGVVDLLNEHKQLILHGPPGTGKTYLARELAERLVGVEQREFIQFHPAYTYEDFFEGYRPVSGSETGTLTFELHAGPFRKLVRRAVGQPDQAFILIIDEINRANLAKVFGELYFLLEYRNQPVELLYSEEQFVLPPNVYLIGTMNTADRSIALLDSAMRRRFEFLALNPSEEPTLSLLRSWLTANEHPDTAARFLDALNARIDDIDAKIGPSYLIHPDQSRERIERKWQTSLLPLLREHFYGEWTQREAMFNFDALWAEATSGGDAGD